ncbi:MAG: hypothetical protein ACK4NF_06575, partial [Planctomycetota bacterium]
EKFIENDIIDSIVSHISIEKQNTLWQISKTCKNFNLFSGIIENKLNNVKINILPGFEIFSITLAVSMFIFMVFISDNVEKVNKKNLDKVESMKRNIIRYTQLDTDNISKNKSNYHTPPVLDSIIKVPTNKSRNIPHQKNIRFSVKNEVSKDEKKFIESLINETYHNR